MLCKLSNDQVKALGGTASNLGAIKAGATFAGLHAAKELGEDLGESIGGMFG